MAQLNSRIFPIYGNTLNYVNIVILFKNMVKQKESQKGLILKLTSEWARLTHDM